MRRAVGKGHLQRPQSHSWRAAEPGGGAVIGGDAARPRDRVCACGVARLECDGVDTSVGIGMRVRRRQRAEEEAQKAPIKMLFPMALLIFPTIMIVLMGPAVLLLLRSALGGLLF